MCKISQKYDEISKRSDSMSQISGNISQKSDILIKSMYGGVLQTLTPPPPPPLTPSSDDTAGGRIKSYTVQYVFKEQSLAVGFFIF